MSQFPWMKMTVLSGGLMGLGYIIMRATTPTPEETYAAMAPDLRRKVDANRAARLAREAEMKKQEAAQSQTNNLGAQKPVWADPDRRST